MHIMCKVLNKIKYTVITRQLSFSILTAIFPGGRGWLVPECLHSGFHWS